MAKLFVLNGRMEGSSFDLKEPTIYVGRSSENHIQIKDLSVSKKHARLYRKKDGYFAEDLNSRNGILINGLPLKPGGETKIEEGLPMALGNVLISMGRAPKEDGMVTQYAIDLSARSGKNWRELAYKDGRITNRRNLELVFEVAATLMQPRDIQNLCETIMDTLFRCLKRIDSGVILLTDQKSDKIRKIITRKRNNKEIKKIEYSPTVVRSVIDEGKARMMSDISFEDESNLSESINLMRIKSIICVPLITKKQIIGAIYVHSMNVPYGFRKDDLFLLTALSSPAASAIENALRYSCVKKREEERTSELAATNRLLKKEVSERKRAEDRLQETNKFLRNLLESSSTISIISTDLDQNVLFWNKGAENIFGYKAEEMVGRKKIDILYPDGETKETINEIRESIFKHKTGLSTELTEIRKDGKERFIHLNLTPRLDDKGDVVGILGIGEDMTERKSLEQELIRAQKMEAIGSLAGGIAHNFNNLLMMIQGCISLMLMENTAAEQVEHLREIERYIRSGTDLTRQLLDFSRGVKSDKHATNINEIISDSADLFGRTNKEIRIHREQDRDLWPVAVDRGQMEQVLLNLYVNAWHAMPTGGDLILRTENVKFDENAVKPFEGRSGRYIKISVTDTGVGMDEKTQKKVFDPFFTTKEMGQGTGLGLTSTYGIIRNHDGFINVQSQKGKGTTFTIYLPASEKGIKNVDA